MEVLLFIIMGLWHLNGAVAFHTTFRSAGNFALGKGSNLYMSVPNPLDTLTSGLASVARLPKGTSVDKDAKENGNVSLRKLFDIENSPDCRRVRERITELDLVVEKIIPAAKNSRALIDSTYEDSLPSEAMAPCLIASLPDDDEKIISGKSNIIDFLDLHFSNPNPVTDAKNENVQRALDIWQDVSLMIAGWMRPGRGVNVSPAVTSSKTVARPAKPLILYSYEGNQFCRLVREVLLELDLVYELRSAGKESPRRAELAELTGGSTQCPYLVDPNTQISMPESADIIQYLYKTYALWTPPYELLEWASDNVMSLGKPVFSSLAPVQAGSTREDKREYDAELRDAIAEIKSETGPNNPVVVYTYDLSPFSSETKVLLERLGVEFKEISLGKEWIPGLMAPGGAIKRVALLEMTGQSSLPNIFVGGESIGGLFSGSPGLLPALAEGVLMDMVNEAKRKAREGLVASS